MQDREGDFEDEVATIEFHVGDAPGRCGDDAPGRFARGSSASLSAPAMARDDGETAEAIGATNADDAMSADDADDAMTADDAIDAIDAMNAAADAVGAAADAVPEVSRKLRPRS